MSANMARLATVLRYVRKGARLEVKAPAKTVVWFALFPLKANHRMQTGRYKGNQARHDRGPTMRKGVQWIDDKECHYLLPAWHIPCLDDYCLALWHSGDW